MVMGIVLCQNIASLKLNFLVIIIKIYVIHIQIVQLKKIEIMVWNVKEILVQILAKIYIIYQMIIG